VRCWSPWHRVLTSPALVPSQTVAGECQSALDWLSEKEALQQQTAKVCSAGGAGCCMLPGVWRVSRCKLAAGGWCWGLGELQAAQLARPPGLAATSSHAAWPLLTPAACLPPVSVSLYPLQYDDPVLLAADVEKKEGTVRRVCEPILSKKPPPPPKKEEPAPQVRCARHGRLLSWSGQPAQQGCCPNGLMPACCQMLAPAMPICTSAHRSCTHSFTHPSTRLPRCAGCRGGGRRGDGDGGGAAAAARCRGPAQRRI